MNHNTEESISITVSISLFIVALSIAMLSIYLQDSSIKVTDQWLQKADHRIVTTSEIKGVETYTGAQVLQILHKINQTAADIQIGNLIFNRNIDIENTDVSGIDTHKNYQVIYERDTDGILQKIIFQ